VQIDHINNLNVQKLHFACSDAQQKNFVGGHWGVSGEDCILRPKRRRCAPEQVIVGTHNDEYDSK